LFSAWGAGAAPEVLVNIGRPAKDDVCPGVALVFVGNGSTVIEGTSYHITASSLTTCISNSCFESLGFKSVGLRKKGKRGYLKKAEKGETNNRTCGFM
jgi:hypothetical protein